MSLGDFSNRCVLTMRLQLSSPLPSLRSVRLGWRPRYAGLTPGRDFHQSIHGLWDQGVGFCIPESAEPYSAPELPDHTALSGHFTALGFKMTMKKVS